MHKRFLRDNALDNMLTEIRSISEKFSRNEFPGFVFTKSLESLTEMYETNKLILQHIEDAIEMLRKTGSNEEALMSLVSAAAHVQIGMISIHNALKEDVNILLGQILELKESLGLQNDYPQAK